MLDLDIIMVIFRTVVFGSLNKENKLRIVINYIIKYIKI